MEGMDAQLPKQQVTVPAPLFRATTSHARLHHERAPVLASDPVTLLPVPCREPAVQRDTSRSLVTLELLYDAYHLQALGLAYRLLGNRPAAEEVVLEAFLSAWRTLGSHDPNRGDTRSWLLAQVRREAFAYQQAVADPAHECRGAIATG